MDLKLAPYVVALAAAQALGLLSLVIRLRSLRRIVASVSLLASALILGVTVGSFLKLWIIPLAFVGVYQLINIARIIEDRMHRQYLRRQVVLSGIIFLVLTIGFSFLKLLESWLSENAPLFIAIYSVFTLVASLMLFVTTLRSLKSTRIGKSQHFYADAELPTVSVLVSARNEDDALTECIHSLLQSDYPKLEIIALDDCSHDKSSDIIKGFASKGVRFIQGEQPHESWLAKNQAYETLANAASGDWLLFSGVDVRLSPTTIRNLVTHALNKKLKMVSVLPHKKGQSALASFLSPLRYFWEMSVPARFHAHQRPAVLSTVWTIEKKMLLKSGGFGAVSRSVNPEGYLAKKSGAYQFIRSNEDIEIATSKPLADQYDTAIRTYYPELRRRIHRVAGTTFLGMITLALPYILAVVFLLTGHALPGLLLMCAAALLTASNLLIITITNPRSWLLGCINFPFVALQEMVLLNISMYRYEFSEVLWKGRNICYPVMHVVPRLPDIDKKSKPTKQAAQP